MKAITLLLGEKPLETQWLLFIRNNGGQKEVWPKNFQVLKELSTQNPTPSENIPQDASGTEAYL